MNTRTLGLSWPLLVGVLTICALMAGSGARKLLGDADTYWHLAAGRWILEHGAVPTTDPFSHTFAGAPWIAHEWLAEALMAAVNGWGGWAGLAFLTAACFAGTLAWLMRFLLARMEPVHALLLTALAGAMCVSHLLVRPHVFAWGLFVVWSGTLVDAAERHRGPPWWLLSVLVVWANLHGSFVMGLALAGALALDACLALERSQRAQGAMRWGAFLFLAVLASMLTPSGWRGLVFPFEVMSMTTALESIQEWQSPNFHRFQFVEVWLLLILGLACVGRVKLPLLRLTIVLGLLHLALRNQRNVALLGLMFPLLAAAPLAKYWATLTPPGANAEALDRFFRALASPARWPAVAVGAALVLAVSGHALRSGGVVPPQSSTPEAALQAARKAGATGNVLNSYGLGGYLVFKGVPVYIDGRADLYGDKFLKEQIDALALATPEALPKLLQERGIGWTLLEKGTPAAIVLDHMANWRRVHTDDVAVVHVRSDAGQKP